MHDACILLIVQYLVELDYANIPEATSYFFPDQVSHRYCQSTKRLAHLTHKWLYLDFLYGRRF